MVAGVILAGGYGKRLRPLTDSIPKPLIEIKENYTILDKQILSLKYAGVREVHLLVGYLWEKINERYGEEWNGMKIRYWIEDEPQGTLYALKNIFSKLEEDSIVSNGDIVADFNLRSLIASAQENKDALIMIAVTRMLSPYGIVDFKDGRILSFREKPLLDYYINAGFYYIKKEAYPYFQEKYEDRAVEKTVFPRLAELGRAYVYKEENIFWQSVDSLKDLERVREEFKNREDRPWGYEKMLPEGKLWYLMKSFDVKLENAKLKIESGRGIAEFENKEIELKVGEEIYIENGRIKALENMLIKIFHQSK